MKSCVRETKLAMRCRITQVSAIFMFLCFFLVARSATAAIAIDVTTFKDGPSAATSITTPAFTTAAGNELLLAFVSTDYLGGANTKVNTVTGAGLTWVLVARANVQSGTSEIWRAFAPSPLTGATVTATLNQAVSSQITVVTFTGVDTSGTGGSGAIGAVATANAASGAPSVSLVTTRANSWVFGVGNDYDNPVARTVGSGQTMVHQYLPPVGDTYWVQRRTAATAAAGTTVTISDTAPTSDRFNLAACEILAPITGGDTTPPTVSVTAPAGGGIVTGTSTLAATASDNVGVVGVTFRIDSADLPGED